MSSSAKRRERVFWEKLQDMKSQKYKNTTMVYLELSVISHGIREGTERTNNKKEIRKGKKTGKCKASG